MMLPDCVGRIGADGFVAAHEVEAVWGQDASASDTWRTYASQFQMFTGATLDPLFHRLSHPARREGRITLDADSHVVVVGCGPSLARRADTLAHVRKHVRIFTSPRGADALRAFGVTPDLVIIEHQTALDAHHSARGHADGQSTAWAECPLIASEWRTPATLLARVRPESLFVPSSLNSWGLWPATAVAMAMDEGAGGIALLGIDLGVEGEPDPVHAPLIALLELLARLAPCPTIDCGGGAHKSGWTPSRVTDLGGACNHGPLGVSLRPAPSREDRQAVARAGAITLAPVVERARRHKALAIEARREGAGAGCERRVHDAIDEMIAWRDDRQVRSLVQDCLGAAFLPRLWRMPIDHRLGTLLWRPLLLATHELVAQAEMLGSLVEQAA